MDAKANMGAGKGAAELRGGEGGWLAPAAWRPPVGPLRLGSNGCVAPYLLKGL